jgi:hypothetical protein
MNSRLGGGELVAAAVAGAVAATSGSSAAPSSRVIFMRANIVLAAYARRPAAAPAVAAAHSTQHDERVSALFNLYYLTEICLHASSQSAPDRRFGKFRCAPRRIGLAGGDGRSTLK